MIGEIEDFHRRVSHEGPHSAFLETYGRELLTRESDNFWLRSFALGTKTPDAPTFLMVGGVHGLERIGAELCFSYLNHLIGRLHWDTNLHQLLARVRIVFIPLLNPVGYQRGSRSNGNGVDLMRNAPVESEERVPFLIGGHRYSKRLPWHRGEPGKLEAENIFLLDVVDRFCKNSKALISVDFHSGFGLKDQLWFPHSFTKKPFVDLPYWHALMALFEQTYPYHIYKVEPQSRVYHLHGDVWDHLYLERKKTNPHIFIPLTLEMGSWSWVKKNPIQLVSRGGLFNPVKDHRKKRIFRRHHLLLDFIPRALCAHEHWVPHGPLEVLKHHGLAMERWYD